jgi:homoserine kinase type II
MNDELETVLARFPADCRPRACSSLGAAGGFSGAAIWKLETPRGTLALRRWPAEHPTPERLAWIHAVTTFAARNGFGLLPQPVLTNDGVSFVTAPGGLWQLEPWLPGEADYRTRPSEQKLKNALAALARFHRAVESFGSGPHRGPSPGVAERRVRLSKLIAGGLAELRAALDARGVRPDITEIGRRWLDLIPRSAALVGPLLDRAAAFEVSLQPCLRDVWSDHVLFVSDEVSGIVDLGAMRVETVATDVARLLGSLAGDDKAVWSAGLAAYRAIRPLDEHELESAAAIDRGNVVLAGPLWMRWMLLEGRQFENVGAIVERLRIGLARLEVLVKGAGR